MQIASRAYRPSMSYACTLQVERSRSRTVVLSGRRRRPRHRASQATTSIFYYGRPERSERASRGVWFVILLQMVAALSRVASGRAIKLELKVWESVFCKFKRLYNREKDVIESNCM